MGHPNFAVDYYLCIYLKLHLKYISFNLDNNVNIFSFYLCIVLLVLNNLTLFGSYLRFKNGRKK